MRAVALTLLLFSCAAEPPARSPPKEEQSYPDAVRTICDVDRLAKVDAEDPLGIEGKRSEYLMDHVHNSDGIYLVTLYRVKDLKEQTALIADAVTETKLTSCPLLDTLRGQASSPSAPREQSAR